MAGVDDNAWRKEMQVMGQAKKSWDQATATLIPNNLDQAKV